MNDIYRICNEQTTKKDLFTIVKKLKEAGVKVIIQTIPPFNYNEEKRMMWDNLNNYIKNELSKHVDLVIDSAPLLGDENGQSWYEEHPNEEGCRVWAEYLYSILENYEF